MARLRKTARDETLAATRNKLLEAATTEFANEGYVGANINSISEAAGFAKGTIYNHFLSKRTLMLTLIDKIADEHIAFILQRVELDHPPAWRLEAFFNAGFTFIEHCPEQARVIVNALYGPDAGFRARVYQAYERLFTLIARDIVALGIARGDFREVNTDLITALVMTIYLGSCSQLDSNGKIWLDPRQVVEFILDGLRV
jgi:AcrR family transcriptional regulator